MYKSHKAVNEDQVIQVSGLTPDGWYLCELLQEIDEDYMISDMTGFRVHEVFLENIFLKDGSLDFLISDRKVANEYSHMVKSKQGRVDIYDIPSSDKGKVTGYVMKE